MDAATVVELFAQTLAEDYDDERAWAAVHVLRRQDIPEVFDLAARFCESEIPLKRARGLDVLAQLGAGSQPVVRPHFDDCVRIAMRHLTDEDPLVAHSAAWALAHLGNEVANTALIGLRTHSDSGVRHAVACGLAGSQSPDAIRVLIELMEDTDDEVRNWATFGLGEPVPGESPEVLIALKKRLADPFPDAREEAIWGLARRKAPVGLQLLLERLESGDIARGDELAAADTLGLDYLPEFPLEDLCSGLRKILSS